MWPFGSRREVRNYTSTILDAVHSVADSASGGSPEKTFAVEAGIRLLADIVSTARLEGPGPIVQAVGEVGLGAMARGLLLRGSANYWIQSGVSGIRLIPVVIEGITGGPDPATWAFKVSAPGPSSSLRTELSNAEILRPVYSTDPARPWDSVGPLERAGVSASLLGKLESAFAQEAGTTVATILPLDHPFPDGFEEREGTTSRLAEDFKNLRGRLRLFLAHPSRGDGAPRNVPRSDLQQIKLGPRYDVATAEARAQVGADALAAMGISAVLFDVTAAGTSRREAWRQLFAGAVLPLAEKILSEIRVKLGHVSASWDSAAFQDQLGRASISKRLTESGVSIERSLELAGL